MQLSWFPFFLFDTDWMGREVYHGNPNGDVSQVQAYDQGVREGAFGLLLNSVRTHIEHHDLSLTLIIGNGKLIRGLGFYLFQNCVDLVLFLLSCLVHVSKLVHCFG